MDDARKQNILSHIDKIEQYARQPGNEWLLVELQKRFCVMSNMTELQRIEKYLALDYYIDNISTRIDYSFVKDDLLRMKLLSDWREMLRCRCHVRKHKPDFLEFCRFAHMQVEGITNYYCMTAYPTPEELHSACKTENEKVVTFWNKLYLLQQHNIIRYADKEFLYGKLYMVRNIQSHRGGSTLSDFIVNTRAIITPLIKQYNLPTLLGDDSIVNLYMINSDEGRELFKEPYILFKKQLENLHIDYTRYEALLWCKKTPYEEVEARLEKLVSNIKHVLL